MENYPNEGRNKQNKKDKKDKKAKLMPGLIIITVTLKTIEQSS